MKNIKNTNNNSIKLRKLRSNRSTNRLIYCENLNRNLNSIDNQQNNPLEVKTSKRMKVSMKITRKACFRSDSRSSKYGSTLNHNYVVRCRMYSFTDPNSCNNGEPINSQGTRKKKKKKGLN